MRHLSKRGALSTTACLVSRSPLGLGGGRVVSTIGIRLWPLPFGFGGCRFVRCPLPAGRTEAPIALRAAHPSIEAQQPLHQFAICRTTRLRQRRPNRLRQPVAADISFAAFFLPPRPTRLRRPFLRGLSRRFFSAYGGYGSLGFASKLRPSFPFGLGMRPVSARSCSPASPNCCSALLVGGSACFRRWTIRSTSCAARFALTRLARILSSNCSQSVPLSQDSCRFQATAVHAGWTAAKSRGKRGPTGK